jgi:hypothetical protein
MLTRRIRWRQNRALVRRIEWVVHEAEHSAKRLLSERWLVISSRSSSGRLPRGSVLTLEESAVAVSGRGRSALCRCWLGWR